MFLQRLALNNVLSFKDSNVELRQLNVLIGPNAVGKSNLIEAISLLQATPTSLASEILRGGGVRQWLWLRDRVASPIGSVECDVRLTSGRQLGQLAYRLEFSEDANGFVIVGEHLAKDHLEPSPPTDVYFSRSFNNAEFGPKTLELTRAKAQTMTISPTESVLSQFKNPVDPTPITNLGNHFDRIKIFREFRTGVGSPARQGIATTVPKDFLSEGGDNLALALHELDFQGAHNRIKDYIRRFCDRFEDVKIRVGAGLAQAFLRETGLAESLSAIRMSDGTLKFLCLLAALFNPTPPPLMCIEEPELGMHPDALQLIAEALVEASQSVQLIITTHSEALVDALSEYPESVLVCERDFENSTQCKRLSAKELHGWLERYTLGQLWRKGEIGGGRW
jgi:predicted ATPase